MSIVICASTIGNLNFNELIINQKSLIDNEQRDIYKNNFRDRKNIKKIRNNFNIRKNNPIPGRNM